MSKETNGKDVLSWLNSLKQNKGGAFQLKALKHGGSPRAVAINAVTQIFEAMKKKNTEVITVRRRFLAELFGASSLVDPKNGRPPKLKSSVSEHLKARGIDVVYFKGFVDFIKIPPKTNPRI